MPRAYICTEDQAIWERRKVRIIVPDDVIVEGDEAVQDFLFTSYQDGAYNEVHQPKYLGPVDTLDTRLSFEPEWAED